MDLKNVDTEFDDLMDLVGLAGSVDLVGVMDLPLRDMLSLGAWRMGLGCSGKILPPLPPSP